MCQDTGLSCLLKVLPRSKTETKESSELLKYTLERKWVVGQKPKGPKTRKSLPSHGERKTRVGTEVLVSKQVCVRQIVKKGPQTENLQ